MEARRSVVADKLQEGKPLDDHEKVVALRALLGPVRWAVLTWLHPAPQRRRAAIAVWDDWYDAVRQT